MKFLFDPAFLIDSLIGLLGVIIALYQVWPTRNRKEPIWAIDTTYLIRGFHATIGDLKVLFRDEPVEHLSVSRLVV